MFNIIYIFNIINRYNYNYSYILCLLNFVSKYIKNEYKLDIEYFINDKKMYKWYKDNFKFKFEYLNFDNCAIKGRLECIKKLHTIKCPLRGIISTQENFHNNFLKWLHNKGCPLERVSILAAKYGHLKILKWIKNKGFPINNNVVVYTAINGNLSCLKWLIENNFEWSDNFCQVAISNNNLDLYNWAIENGCPCEKDNINHINE